MIKNIPHPHRAKRVDPVAMGIICVEKENQFACRGVFKGDELMIKQLSWKVGGQQGEGIESTGEIFCLALNRMGYYLYGYRHFSSRIKGGHSNNKIRISTHPLGSISDELDVLVALIRRRSI